MLPVSVSEPLPFTEIPIVPVDPLRIVLAMVDSAVPPDVTASTPAVET